MELSRAQIQDLYHRHGAMVHRRCRALLGDEQEAYDVMQEAFIRLLRAPEQLRGDASPTTWLYRVSTNLCLNRLRDQRSRQKKLAEPDPSASHLPGMSEQTLPDPDRRKLVSSLLERADDETRAIVVYYFMDELTLEEISGLVELSVPTIRKRIQAFQAGARRALGPLSTLLIAVLSLAHSPWLFQAGAGHEPLHLSRACPLRISDPKEQNHVAH